MTPRPGKSSIVPTAEHTIPKYGKYWKCEADIDEIRQHKLLVSRAARAGYNAYQLDEYQRAEEAGIIKIRARKGEGVSSATPTPKHKIKGSGRYWRTQEDLDEYNQRCNLVKRAKQAGYDYTQIDEYLAASKETVKAVDLTRRREKRDKNELNKLKAKYGLSKNANRIHLRKVYERTGDPEIAKYLHILSTEHTSDAEKLQHIRKLFMSGINPYDILYQVALTVGINLRKTS
jgi:hypothetical protein